MSMLVSFVLSFFPRDVLDEILNLIGSVSEGFPSYSLVFALKSQISSSACFCAGMFESYLVKNQTGSRYGA